MNLHQLQADLRHFAAERDWQPFHTPKNLSTALVVEAAELAELFQWMTAEASQIAHRDSAAKQQIGEEVADVLLYLLQLADYCEIDIAQAVKDKLAHNTQKHPAKRTIVRDSPMRAAARRTYVLLDYENVQPTQEELRALVPDASQVWVFHGPHQREIERRFPSFGNDVIAVPISRTGKNALDFHLSFYTGYLASRNQASTIVVVAKDKGYGPMIEHARVLGFEVRQQGHDRPGPGTSAKAAGAKPAAKKVAHKKSNAPTPAAKKVPVKKATPPKKAVTKPANVPAARKLATARPNPATPAPALSSAPSATATESPSVPVDLLRRVAANLRKMNDKRPSKAASLRRTLKSFLSVEAGDRSIEVALSKLIAEGVVALSAKGDVSYPGMTAVLTSAGA